MPGTPGAGNSDDHADSGVSLGWFERLDEEVIQENRAHVLVAMTIRTDSKQMQACVDLRGDVQHKFDRLSELLLRDIPIIMGDIQPIRDLITELVDDLVWLTLSTWPRRKRSILGSKTVAAAGMPEASN